MCINWRSFEPVALRLIDAFSGQETMMRSTVLAMAALGAVLAGCSRPAPPPTPESSADNAAASAPAGTGAQREKLPDPVNDGRPTAATQAQEAVPPAGQP
jgi:hypothetical protein